jgi:hypothetical protein
LPCGSRSTCAAIARRISAAIERYADEALDETQAERRLGLRRTDRARYTNDPRYEAALRLLQTNAEMRAEIERRLRPLPDRAMGAAVRPKVLRRELSGPITIR